MSSGRELGNEMGGIPGSKLKPNPSWDMFLSVVQQVLNVPSWTLSHSPHLHRSILTLSFTPALAQFTFVSYDSEVSSYAHV